MSEPIQEVLDDVIIVDESHIEQVEQEEVIIVEDDESEITCWGCREGILNQLGHIDPGGCLYYEPYTDDEAIETMSVAESITDK